MLYPTSMTATGHRVIHFGDPKTVKAKVDSLTGAGPLLIAKDHVAAKALPEAVLDGPTEAQKKMVMRDWMMLLPQFLI